MLNLIWFLKDISVVNVVNLSRARKQLQFTLNPWTKKE